ncbi:uncharacterized protein LOC127833349 [Dreissena polymorpha]|nr:uncharacterized protein LOC127833349 [Dreissena polymorpha]
MIKQHLRIKEAHNVSNEYPSVTVKPTRNPRDRCQSRTPPCCVPGILEIHLNKIKGLRPKQGSLEGVSVDIQKPKGRGRRQACSSTAVIVADFERLDAAMCTTGCLEGPYCGRRMLKLQLRLSDSKRCGMLLHVSDNKASDGERNKTVYSAEVQGRFPSMDIFPNDQCKTNNNSVQMPDSISGCVNDVTIYVSHHYIRVTSDVGMDYMLCHTCLSDLNKISNNTMYIALNRVLGDINQEGYGVCSAILTWECPWSNN